MKNKTLFWQFSALFCLLSIAFLPALAQEQPEKARPDSLKVLISADTAPEFPGGNKALLQFLVDNLKEVDLKHKPEGLSIIQFIVTKEGTIKDIEVIRSLEPTLDQAAIEAIKKMPKWIPGLHKGQIVDVRFTLPVRFSRENQQKTKIKKKSKQ
jgi:TonB family protein